MRALSEGETTSASDRADIWARFGAEVGSADGATPEPAPVIPGPGSAGFPWKLFAAPVAAGLLALVAWSAGLFDTAPTDPTRPGDNLQARAHPNPGPTIGQQAPVIQAVFAADRQFRRQRDAGADANRYGRRLRQALDGKSMVAVWFDEKAVSSRKIRIEEVGRIVAECPRGPAVQTAHPEKAVIEACCVHEITIDGNTARIPHVLLDCEDRKLSAYFLCGSLRPVVEAAMKRCAKLSDASLEDGVTTKIHQCPECAVFALPRGDHLMVLVSDLAPEVMDEVVELF